MTITKYLLTFVKLIDDEPVDAPPVSETIRRPSLQQFTIAPIVLTDGSWVLINSKVRITPNWLF